MNKKQEKATKILSDAISQILETLSDKKKGYLTNYNELIIVPLTQVEPIVIGSLWEVK